LLGVGYFCCFFGRTYIENKISHVVNLQLRCWVLGIYSEFSS